MQCNAVQRRSVLPKQGLRKGEGKGDTSDNAHWVPALAGRYLLLRLVLLHTRPTQIAMATSSQNYNNYSTHC